MRRVFTLCLGATVCIAAIAGSPGRSDAGPTTCPRKESIRIENDLFVADGPGGRWKDVNPADGHALPVTKFWRTYGSSSFGRDPFRGDVCQASRFSCSYGTADGHLFTLVAPSLENVFKVEGENWYVDQDRRPSDHPFVFTTCRPQEDDVTTCPIYPQPPTSAPITGTIACPAMNTITIQNGVYAAPGYGGIWKEVNPAKDLPVTGFWRAMGGGGSSCVLGHFSCSYETAGGNLLTLSDPNYSQKYIVDRDDPNWILSADSFGDRISVAFHCRPQNNDVNSCRFTRQP